MSKANPVVSNSYECLMITAISQQHGNRRDPKERAEVVRIDVVNKAVISAKVNVARENGQRLMLPSPCSRECRR
jgi:hypothetical protein